MRAAWQMQMLKRPVMTVAAAEHLPLNPSRKMQEPAANSWKSNTKQEAVPRVLPWDSFLLFSSHQFLRMWFGIPGNRLYNCKKYVIFV
jgi:hypothetical protein